MEENEQGSLIIVPSLTTNSNNNEESASHGQNYYYDEWRRLFSGPNYIEKLREIGLKGQLRSCRFRSICWRIYLDCLPEHPSEWISKTKSLREKYWDLLNKLKTNPRTDGTGMDLTLNNPLSQEEQSPWNQYFQDSELKITIRQDVIRTFPEIEFFHTTQIQSMMVNILFCYAREHPNVCYRQGMHELLAPIIFVLHSDEQAFLHASEIDLLEEEIGVLLDPEYIEYDAYYMFCQIMEVVEVWYVINEGLPMKYMDQFILEPFSRPPDSGPSSILGVKLTKIYEQTLRRLDVELFNHLEMLEIAPQIYGIRWLRLLFGREFSMQDLLVVWDAIFANSLSFDLVDYIFTAMLMYIRDLLLSGDYTTCLSYLMRFPPIADVHYIIDLALHLRDPKRYSKPVGYSIQMLQHNPVVGGRRDIHRAPVKNGYAESSNVQSTSKENSKQSSSTSRWISSRPKSLAIGPAASKVLNRNKSSSEPATLESSPSPEVEASCTEEPDSIPPIAASSKMPRDSFQHHSRFPSDTSTQLLAQAGSEFHHASGPLEYRTLPHKIKDGNVINHLGLRKSGLSHSLSHLEASGLSSGREMVPLSRQSTAKATTATVTDHSRRRGSRHSIKEKDQELCKLRAEISELSSMTEYCCRRMTQHLDRLQEQMMSQPLQFEDDMFLAIAGLKRVRDILKGTVSFAQEVTDDDDESGSIVECSEPAGETLTIGTSDHDFDHGPLESYVVVRQDMCSGPEVGNCRDPENNKILQDGQESIKSVNKKQNDSNNIGSSFGVAKREIRKFFFGSMTSEKSSDLGKSNGNVE